MALRFSSLSPILLLAVAVSPFAHALDPRERLSEYIVTRWDAEDGLPQNLAREIVQTRDGYLWLGTGQGLARFDGLTFTNFKRPRTAGFPGVTITSLVETADGALWVGTNTGLGKFQNGRFTGYTRQDGLKADTVTALCEAPDRSLWIGTANGITRWRDGRFSNDLDTSGYAMQGLRDMFADRAGRIWIAAGSHGLCYADGKFTDFSRDQGLPAQGVQMFRDGPNGSVIAVTQSGLLRLDSRSFVPLEHPPANSHANTALVDREGNFWVGTTTGLERLGPTGTERYVTRAGDPIGGVDSLFEDREGSLWVGSSAGLYRFNNRRATTWSNEQGVLGTLALAVVQSRDGSIWISSWTGGVVRFHQGQTTQYRAGAPLSNENVTAIYEAPDGSMWFGNRGSALDHLEGDRVTTYVFPPGVATSRFITAVHADASGEVIAAIAGRGLFHVENGALAPLPNAPDFSQHTIWALRATRDGVLLLGSTKGLYRRNADRTWSPVAIAGLGTISIRAIHEDRQGALWLGTDDSGLVRWQGRVVHAYGKSEGMIDDGFSGVIEDDEGALWLTAVRGISRVLRSELDAFDRGELGRLNPITLGRSDGLSSGSTPSASGAPVAAHLQDGRLVFATVKGVAVVLPRDLQINRQPPAVAIEAITTDDRRLEVDLNRRATIPAGVNRFEIHYTGLSLIAPQQIRFRYRLQGSDLTWVEAGHARSATYTHVAPGTYQFSVFACNSDGVWSPAGATLALTIEPRFHQTLWFRAFATVAFVVGVAGAIGWRIRRLKNRAKELARLNAELDQRVRERTAELQQREMLFRLIFEHAPVGIAWSRTDLGIGYHLNSTLRNILGLSEMSAPNDRMLLELTHPDDAPRQLEKEASIASGRSDVYTLEQRFMRKDGTTVHALLAAAVVRDQQGAAIQQIRIVEDITDLKRAQHELITAHQRLMEASRQAGMAEIATDVLHNIGNVLNSVNVSTSLLADGLRGSKVDALEKLTALLRDNTANLARFLQDDPKGQRVLPYLESLAAHLSAERKRLAGETDALRRSVEHIKQIVARQETFAHYSGIVESVPPAELLEDALHMTAVALTRHGIEVIREFAPCPPVMLERHKALQIVTNLLQNAKHALDAQEPGRRQLRLRLEPVERRVRFVVEDNGAGIPAENLTRIFEFGFTTRHGGHGFGLHYCANAAKEMHGSLCAQSAGPGHGATFILELPIENAAASAPRA